MCTVILWQDYWKGNSREFFWYTVGKTFSTANVFVNRARGLFLSAYVDDIKLAGKKQNINPHLKSPVYANKLDVQEANFSSHSSTESEIISLDAGLGLDGIPALDLWDLIVLVFGNTTQNHDRTVKLVEIISLDAGLRMDGIPALDLLNLVKEVFHCDHQPNKTKASFSTGQAVASRHDKHTEEESNENFNHAR